MEVSQSLVVLGAFIAGFGCMLVARTIWNILTSSLQLLLFAGLAFAAIHFMTPQNSRTNIVQTALSGVHHAVQYLGMARDWFQSHQLDFKITSREKSEK